MSEKTTPDYEIDKEAIKAGVDAEMNTAIENSNKGYDDIVAKNEATKNEMLDKIGVQDSNGNWNEGSWADIQTDIQNQQTDFAIEKINQQKDQTRKDYLKEQSGAYTDWQKQSNQYGANAEQMAANGMTNTGYSESSLVSMYNQYQNRMATARESYQRAVLNYNNAITEAKLQNNSALAEIAIQALEKSSDIIMTFTIQNNTLLTEKVKQRLTLEQNYHQRYMDLLGQENAENALAETVRYHDDTMQLQKDQLAWEKQKWNATQSKGGTVRGGGGGVKGSGTKGGTSIGGDKVEAVIKDDGGSKSSKTNTKEPTVDMQSVMNLGFGPISASKLNDLVESGRVAEYEENGKLKYSLRYVGRGKTGNKTKGAFGVEHKIKG